MIDWILGFVTAVVFSWAFLGVVFFGAILVERAERIGWSSFLGVLVVVSLWGLFDLSALTGLGWYTLAAIFVTGGIIHAIWRWFRSTAIITEKFNEWAESNNVTDVTNSRPGDSHNYRVGEYMNATNFRENLDKITYWTLAWPVSGAAHLLGDVVVGIKNMFTTFFSGIFDKISERARGKAVIDVSSFDN